MANKIKTNGGALIDPSMFNLSETAFINSYTKEFKMSMFRNCDSVADCDKELKALYAIYGKKKKQPKQEK